MTTDTNTNADTNQTAKTTPPTELTGARVITAKEFMQRLSLKPTAFYNWQNPNSPQYKANFPKPFSLGGRLNGYLYDEVEQFIFSLADTRKRA